MLLSCFGIVYFLEVSNCYSFLNDFLEMIWVLNYWKNLSVIVRFFTSHHHQYLTRTKKQPNQNKLKKQIRNQLLRKIWSTATDKNLLFIWYISIFPQNTSTTRNFIKFCFRSCSFSRKGVPLEIPERLLPHQSHGVIGTHPRNYQISSESMS